MPATPGDEAALVITPRRPREGAAQAQGGVCKRSMAVFQIYVLLLYVCYMLHLSVRGIEMCQKGSHFLVWPLGKRFHGHTDGSILCLPSAVAAYFITIVCPVVAVPPKTIFVRCDLPFSGPDSLSLSAKTQS